MTFLDSLDIQLHALVFIPTQMLVQVLAWLVSQLGPTQIIVQLHALVGIPTQMLVQLHPLVGIQTQMVVKFWVCLVS